MQRIGILLFDDVEELDAVGPWEVFGAWAHALPRRTGPASACSPSSTRRSRCVAIGAARIPAGCQRVTGSRCHRPQGRRALAGQGGRQREDGYRQDEGRRHHFPGERRHRRNDPARGPEARAGRRPGQGQGPGSHDVIEGRRCDMAGEWVRRSPAANLRQRNARGPASSGPFDLPRGELAASQHVAGDVGDLATGGSGCRS